jgi:hypothetical protein
MKRREIMIKVQELGQFGTLLDNVKSDTGDTMYEIRWNKNTGYFCSCPGWATSKKKPKSCKHIRRFEFKYKLEQKLMEMSSRGFVDFQSEGARDNIINGILTLAKKNWEGVI